MSDGTERIKVGIVGLGTIAQAIHLPYLARLWDRFEIVHVSDIATGLAGDIASTLGTGIEASPDPRAVFDDDEVEAVLILASGPHGPTVRAALEAGKHVFVEKPLALTVAEAIGLDGLARSVERVLQVGYMKLHDPVVAVAVAEARSIVEPRLLRITVLHPAEADQQRHLRIRRSSVPDEALAAARAYEAQLIEQAIGPLPEVFGWLYREVALGSLVHQVSLARHLLGSSLGDVVSCDAWPFEVRDGGGRPDPDPPTIAALSEVSPGLRLALDWVWSPGVPEYVERYELLGIDARLELEMPTPYALDQHGRLRVDRDPGPGRPASVGTSDHRSGFQVQLEVFGSSIIDGPPYPSDAAAAAEDTRFLQAIIATLARGRGFSPGGESAGS